MRNTIVCLMVGMFALMSATHTQAGAAAIPGDTDFDGDVDDADLATIFSSFTGPVGAAGGKNWWDGDTDFDGDVDDVDLANAFSNYTGPIGG